MIHASGYSRPCASGGQAIAHVPVIVGPTGIGKSHLAFRLALELGRHRFSASSSGDELGEILQEAGVTVAPNPSELGSTVARVFTSIRKIFPSSAATVRSAPATAACRSGGPMASSRRR